MRQILLHSRGSTWNLDLPEFVSLCSSLSVIAHSLEESIIVIDYRHDLWDSNKGENLRNGFLSYFSFWRKIEKFNCQITLRKKIEVCDDDDQDGCQGWYA